MASSTLVPDAALEKWSPLAFAGGGVAWLLLMGIIAGNMASGGSTPTWIVPLFLVPGLLLGYVGLLGIYVRVADRSPRLARAGVAVVAIATALVTFAVVYTVATSTVDEGPPSPVFPLIILTTVLSFVILGIASARTETPSRTLGLLVMVPGVAWFGDVVYIGISSALGIREVAGISLVVVPMMGVVIASLAMVAIGYLLQTRFPATDRSEAAPDTASG